MAELCPEAAATLAFLRQTRKTGHQPTHRGLLPIPTSGQCCTGYWLSRVNAIFTSLFINVKVLFVQERLSCSEVAF
jgi:hypothetical protein